MRHKGLQWVYEWMMASGKPPFEYQMDTWEHMSAGKSGLVCAPTGVGKTFAVFLGAIAAWQSKEAITSSRSTKPGLTLIWITPLRALAKDLQQTLSLACTELGLDWEVQYRSGDVSEKVKRNQVKNMPQVLITTPESLHLLFTHQGNSRWWQGLGFVIVDEWHEFLGTKRGLLVELALSRLRAFSPGLQTWALSATLGNMMEAMEVVLGHSQGVLVKSNLSKPIHLQTLLPKEIDTMPWAGHLGLKLLPLVFEVINKHRTVLLFTNTRSQSELWYHALIDAYPELAGAIAIHHSAIDADIRTWIEEAIHQAKLKVVVCTSTLDLGVDFRPVDAVIQIGSPKGIARFVQRAGRSGHAPQLPCIVYFVPTYALEILEADALRTAIDDQILECKQPLSGSMDMLIQYMLTLATGDGLEPISAYHEVTSTFAYSNLSAKQWDWALQFLTHGGYALQAYPEFRKISLEEDHKYRVSDRRMAIQHRINMGAIVSESNVKVRFLSGGTVGHVEEYFISQLSVGEVFSLAGKKLELVQLRGMEAWVRLSKSEVVKFPSWQGGRMPLSSNLGALLLAKHEMVLSRSHTSKEMAALMPLYQLQASLSHVPSPSELLVEYIVTKREHHVFIYTFQGRLVHEVLACLISYRLSAFTQATFSLAMNDYGFQLLSDSDIDPAEWNWSKLLDTRNILTDIQQSFNISEVAKRKFRQIAVISGLIFKGYPGKTMKTKHLTLSSSMLYEVFKTYESDHPLLLQAQDEAFSEHVQLHAIVKVLDSMSKSKKVIQRIDRFTPFSFPLKVDSLRETLSNEQLETRIQKLLNL